MAKKNAGGGTGNTPTPAAKTAPAPATKPAPIASNKPGFFSWLGKMTFLVALGVTEAGHEINLSVQEALVPLYRRGWFVINSLIFFIFIGYGFNIVGWKEVNIVFLLAFNWYVSMEASRPDYLTTVAYTGSLVGVLDANARITRGATVFLGFYELAVLNLQLYGSLAFVVLSHIPFTERPFIFPTAIAVLIVILQIKTVWEMPGKFGKRFIYAAAIFLLAFDFFLLVPEALWIEKTGHNLNPLAYLSVPKDKEVIHKIEAKNAENMAKDNAESLKELRETVDNGDVLTTEQLSDLEEKRKTAARNAAGIKPISYTEEELNWETLETKTLVPDKWTPEDLGFQEYTTFKIDPAGKPVVIKVDAVGTYQQLVKSGNREYYKPVDIKVGLDSNPTYKDRLPLKNRFPECGVVMVNGHFYALGEPIELTEGIYKVYISTNWPQNWSSSGQPSENFAANKGEIKFMLKTRV